MMRPLVEYTYSGYPIVVAHRGSSGTSPENTMVAIREGVEEAGATMVEIDVQRTLDDRLIVFHDPVLGRTTDGSGRVENTTSEQIVALDAGGWMHERFVAERVPRLDDVLAYLRGRAYVNIELKRHERNGDEGLGFLEEVHRAIFAAGIMDQTLLSSFDHNLIGRSVDLHPEIPCAVVMHPDDRSLPSERALPVGARAVVIGKHQISHARALDARDHRLAFAIYTINTAEDAERAMRYEPDALVTNFPDRIGRYLESRNST